MENAGQHERDKSTHFFVEHTETGEILDINDPRYESVEGLLRPGVYRHYKSTPDDLKYYSVAKVVMDGETDLHLVIYRPLCETDDRSVYAQPLDIFTSDVHSRKGKIPRFRYIGQNL